MPTVRHIDRIVVHHSAGPRTQTVEAIRRDHKDNRGFSDIGYHLVIDGEARVRKGRDWRLVGAHAKGSNIGSIGICVLGDNTRDEHVWTDDQKAALRALLDTLHAMWPDAVIQGHCDVVDTQCPGLDLADLYQTPQAE